MQDGDLNRFLSLPSTQAYLARVRGLSLAEAARLTPSPEQARLSEAVAVVLRGARELRGLSTVEEAVAWLDGRLASGGIPAHRRPEARLDVESWKLVERGDVALPALVLRDLIKIIRIVDDSAPGYAMSVRWTAGPAATEALAALMADMPATRTLQVSPVRVLDLDVLGVDDPAGNGATQMQMGAATGIRAIDAVVLEQLGSQLSPLSTAEIRDRDGVWHLAIGDGHARIVDGPDPHLERQRRIFAPLDRRPAGTRYAFDSELETELRCAVGDDEREIVRARDTVESYLAGPGGGRNLRASLLRRIRARAPVSATTVTPTFADILRESVLPAAGITRQAREIGGL